VVIVSESIVRRYFAGKAIGRRIIIPELKFNIDGGKDIAAEIVGVVGDVCVHSVEDCQAEHIYLPEKQNALRMENLLARTEGNPLGVAKAIRHAVYLEAPTVPLDDPETLEHRTSYLTDGPKRGMWLLGVFAGLALLLAAVGIYGVSAYHATQRSHEIAIRMALGAELGDIARLIYRRILFPSALGLAIGAGASVWLMRPLRSLLFGVSAGDPKTLVLVVIMLLGVSVLAATGPAVSAALGDPAKVLRRE
jgi:putative ABC transport system permease protein